MLNNKFERSIQFMELIELVHNSELFRERITILSDFELEEILWIFRAIFVDLKNQLGVIEKIKKLIRCSQSMDISLPITEAIEKIVELICEIVSCDRATVFMLDEETGFLWSKVAKGSQGTIRIPKNKGIVGSVVTTGEKIVIEDAYSDPRFNQEVDKKTNYRTKTILCVPIRDSSGNIIGACQAINKINGYFSPDDEYLFELLSKQAGTFLKYAIEYDQNLIFQHRLKTMIQVIISKNGF
jgi:adenylate cyclase